MNQRLFELQLEEAHKNDVGFEKRPIDQPKLFTRRPKPHLPVRLKRYENEVKNVEVKESGVSCIIL